jgi:hypothetical protein
MSQPSCLWTLLFGPSVVRGAQELEGCSMEELRQRAAENRLQLPSELDSDDEHFDPSPDTVADDDKRNQPLTMRAWDAVSTATPYIHLVSAVLPVTGPGLLAYMGLLTLYCWTSQTVDQSNN